SPAVSLAQTRAYPSRGYIPSASTKYTPTRDGRSRSRRCTVLVCARTSSTSSNGRYCVNSPRCPGANTPAATVTARVIVVVADWERNGTSGGRDDRDGLTPIYQRSRPPTTPAPSGDPLDKITDRLTSRLCLAEHRRRGDLDGRRVQGDVVLDQPAVV